MVETLLRPKLSIPLLRPNLVPRPNLIKRLNQSMQLGHKLTLVSAPAGFGKTSLVSKWVRACDRSGAWLSLDKNDNDLTRFLIYLITTLRRIDKDFGFDLQVLLSESQSPQFDILLTKLINEIEAIRRPSLLVLDDYHLIDSKPIHDALNFIVDHLPSAFHLVVISRSDPPLPISRLRVQREMAEIRTPELRFTEEEIAILLNDFMNFGLNPDDIAALERRTEGWVAGLQLAALSLQNQGDRHEFINAFSGSHRYVMDYLIEEVLEHQSESVQIFLMQTAVLDRMNGSLCDALTGQEDGQATLEMLEHSNLFIVPLDNERRWYHYHHLFADLLRQRLNQTQPEQVSTLHRQAGIWYEDQGLAAEALQHIFASGDFQWAGRKVEQVGNAMLRGRGVGNWTTIQNWLEKFPKDVIHSRPKLCLLSAWIMHFSGRPEATESYLRSIESNINNDGDELITRADHLTEITETTSDEPLSSSDIQSMMAEVAIIRAITALARGDLALAIELYHRALELLPSEELHLRALIFGGLADTHYLNANIDAASLLYSEARETSLESGNIYQALAMSSRLAELQVMQGHLHQAADTYQQMQNLYTRWDGQNPSLAGYACVGMGEIMCEWNDLDAAVQQLTEGIERGKQGANPIILLIGYVTLTRALQALGDVTGALDTIQEALRVWQKYPLSLGWSVPPVATFQVRLNLAQGDVASAARWAQEQGLHADDEPSFQREVDYITLARLLIAQDNLDEAVRLLKRLLENAEAGGRILRVIEILLLQGLALKAQGATDQAVTTLERALTLAKPEGFIRIFVDEGKPMAELLLFSIMRDSEPNYAKDLLAAFPKEVWDAVDIDSKLKTITQPLIEPLSDREIEVLRLMAAGYKYKEIAESLFISINTVRHHNRNIFSKLNVNSRFQAIERAREMHLL